MVLLLGGFVGWNIVLDGVWIKLWASLVCLYAQRRSQDLHEYSMLPKGDDSYKTAGVRLCAAYIRECVGVYVLYVCISRTLTFSLSVTLLPTKTGRI